MLVYRAACFYIIILVILGQFAIEMYLPSMPEMAQYFHLPISQIQYSITAFVFGACFGAFFYGGLSDMWGRRPLVIVGLAIGAIGSFICCIVTHIEWLLIGRFIQGIGLAGVGVVARSMTKDVSADSISMAKLASILAVSYSASVALAPIIGGYIQHYSFWRVNFIVMFSVSFILALSSWFTLPETRHAKYTVTWRKLIRDYVEILQNPQFLLYNVISLLALGGAIAYQTISSYLLQIRAGLTPEDFGYTAAAITLSIIIGGVFNSWTVERRGVDKMMKVGCYLSIIAGVLYIIGGIFDLVSLAFIILPIIIFTIGAAIIYPNASSSSISLFGDKAGAASSIYNSLQLVGATMGSALVSLVNAHNQWFLGVLYVATGILSLKLIKLVTHINLPI